MAVLAVDWDGTVVKTSSRELLEGARDMLRLVRERGHSVIIHSANSPKWIKESCDDLDIRYDLIWQGPGKPPATIYADDRAYRFCGDWKMESQILLDILENGGIKL